MNVNKLIAAAESVREHAYCPYSKCKVGAAILCKNGEIFWGCNIENSSFGMTICAERVAVFNAVCSGNREFEAIAIVTRAKKIVNPCGACMQVLTEFSPDIRVIISNGTETIDKNLKDLNIKKVEF